MQKNQDIAQQRNEGEGNRTSARNHNEEPMRLFDSGRIDQEAHEIERDRRAADIRRELANAPMIGRRHQD